MNETLLLDCACIAQMSYALYQGDTPLVRSICVQNLTDAPLTDLTLTLRFEPAFAQEFTLALGTLPAGEITEIAPVNLILSGEYLRSLTERVHAQVRAIVTSGSETVFTDQIDLDLLPYDPAAANRPVTKQELWERKLLDLSLRNPLLNYRPGSSSVQLLAPPLSVLEDETAKGENIKLLPLPEEWDAAQDEAKLYTLTEGAQEAADTVSEQFKSHKLLTYLTESELQKTLKKLQRQAKVSLEENGANTLYLALGFLKWYETERSVRPRYAPLLLVPVDLVRRITGQTYSLRARDEDTQINITLLELLRQDYGIRIDGLDPVPEDENGVNLSLVFDTVRAGIAAKQGWEVTETAVLGQFSFSQFILWNDIRTRSAELAENKVVASLMSGALEWQPETADLSPSQLDEQVSPSDMAVPTSADSSQLAAIYAASQGESFVLHGPPGTGKSQTITNMIANALYHGKSVLFVAEKMAALSVVQKRLEKLGLAPFCLELHSNKAQKRAVLSQLEAALQVGRVKSPAEYETAADALKSRRTELDALMRSLHEVQPIGMSLYDAIALYDRLSAHRGRLTLDTAYAGSTDAQADAAILELLGRIAAADAELGGLADSPLRNIRCTQYSMDARAQFRQETEQCLAAVSAAQETWNALSLGDAGSFAHYEAAMTALKAAADGEYLPAALTGENTLMTRRAELDALFSAGAQCRSLEESILARFDGTILKIDPEQTKLRWKQNEQKWALPKALGRSKLVKELQAHAKSPAAVTAENYLTVCDELISLQTLRRSLAQTDAALTMPFGALWQQERTDLAKLSALREATAALRTKLDALNDPAVTAMMQQPPTPERTATVSAFDTLKTAMDRLSKDFGADFSGLCGAGDLSALADEASGWLQGEERLRERCVLESLLKELDAKGLTALTAVYRSGAAQASELCDVYRCETAHVTIRYAMEQHPELPGLSGAQLDVRIDEYRRAADEFSALTVQELVSRLSAKIPAPGEALRGNSEISILQRAIKSGGRGLSLRKLFESIPTLLHRMCPCMLMSPISVAQYIDPSFPKFDLVIFDEASQLPTSEAVGAIARGENAVIVGDPKQLPPTAFFTSQHFDEDNADKEDLESVLDDCLALSMPSRHLLWHYRSRHESLIAFSNEHFYDGKLLTFPSPDDLISKVTRVPVEGFYDKSKTRQNRAEAEAVVAEIVRRLSDETLRQESIGVVTFSVVQQNLIDDLLTEAFVQQPELAAWADAMYEPIFIKNLENVQGDERDVILFSIGYGPDQNGAVSMNFGPVNQDGGWRRLNVAVSRARREMKVFSVIRPDQIDLSRTSAEGVAKLRAFLEFADRGALQKQTAAEGTADSFAQILADALETRGYTVKCGVGSSGFRIDAAIVHPDDPERFVLALLLGSRSGLENATARDRCISQPSVLRGLGWQVCQVHILDWLDAPERVLDKIEAAVQDALQAEQSPAPARAEKSADFSGEQFEREEIAEPPARSTPYVTAELGTLGSPESFLLPMAKQKILQAVRTVIETEAPVSRSLVQKRVFAAFGMNRPNQKAAAVFDAVLREMMPSATEWNGTEFFWRDDQIPSAYDGIRQGSGTDKRAPEEIAPEELCAGVTAALAVQVSAPRSELIKAAAKLFGFVRMTPAVEAAFAQALALAAERGIARIDGEQVVLAE